MCKFSNDHWLIGASLASCLGGHTKLDEIFSGAEQAQKQTQDRQCWRLQRGDDTDNISNVIRTPDPVRLRLRVNPIPDGISHACVGLGRKNSGTVSVKKSRLTLLNVNKSSHVNFRRVVIPPWAIGVSSGRYSSATPTQMRQLSLLKALVNSSFVTVMQSGRDPTSAPRTIPR